MKRFLALGVLLAFLAVGLVFGQGAQQAQENQGQAYQEISLFGVQWLLFSGKVLATPEELGATVALLYVRDKAGIAGIAEFMVIMNAEGTKWKIVGGWIRPYSSEEQGFYFGEDDNVSKPGDKFVLLEPKGKVGWQLEWSEEYDQQDKPIIRFYLKKNDSNEEKTVKIIDVKQFVETYLKDK